LGAVKRAIGHHPYEKGSLSSGYTARRGISCAAAVAAAYFFKIKENKNVYQIFKERKTLRYQHEEHDLCL
jgi:hypothetical protein